jgi:hypothetical protein
MEPQWEHDQARGWGSKGSRERGSKTIHGVGWMKTSQGAGRTSQGVGGDQGHAWDRGQGLSFHSRLPNPESLVSVVRAKHCNNQFNSVTEMTISIP